MRRWVIVAAGGLLALILVMLGAAWPLLQSPPRQQPPEPAAAAGPPNVLLITIDTIRADHVSAYGYARSTTPNLDRLAASGALFRRSYAPFSQTNPSHATMMTGLSPATHGLRWHGSDLLKPDIPTLAQLLSASGYRTGAVFSWPSFREEWSGLSRGFQFYQEVVVPASEADQRVADVGLHSQVDGRADVTTDQAIEWMLRDTERPFFLWVHYQDPHFPYAPPPPFDRRFGEPCAACPDGSMKTAVDIASGRLPDAAGTQHLLDLYDGEIAFTDQEIGRMIRSMTRRGLDQRTLIVVTGDHGESFGEKGRWSHPWILDNSVIRVPLIMSLPSAIPAGTVVTQIVPHVDILPTILELVGVTGAPENEGTSLVPLLSGLEDGANRFAVSETVDFGQMSLVRDRWKIIKDTRTGSVALYDLDGDPGESTDLADFQPDVLSSMVDTLDAWMSARGVSPPPQ